MAMRRPIGLALENEEVMATGTEVVDTEAVEVVEEVQEVAEQAEEVSGDVAQVEEAEADVAVVEQIEEVLEKAVESGEGISETAAEIAQIAVESMQRRLGIKAAKMPSLESFGSASSRVTATRVALEGIKDTAKKAWEAIVAFVKSIAEKVVNFFKGMFDITVRLQNRADKLKAKAAANKGTPDGKVDSKAVYTAFRGDKANVKPYLNTAYGQVGSVIEVPKLINGLVDVVKGAGEGEGALEKAMEEAFKKGEEAGKKMAGAMPKQASAEDVKLAGSELGSSTYAFVSGEMAGGSKIYSEAGLNDGKFHMLTKVITPEEVKSDKAEMDVLTTSEIEEVCTSVKEIGQSLHKLKDMSGDMKKIVSSVASLAGKYIEGERGAAVRKAITDFSKTASTATTSAASLVLKTATASLNYAEASLAKHKAA